MHIIRETEKDTQKRVIEFFQDALNYTYLGNWADSVDENSNIIPEDLTDWLRKQNHVPNIIIVVDKLLTGFDAPPATYLYIDKSMQDHGLFQAICRVNRIDSDDKEFGYIVDYKDLFGSLRQAMTDYTGEAFENYDTEKT